MRVDEAGRQRHALRVQLAIGGQAAQFADRRDAIAADADIAGKARRAGAVDNGGVADDEVAAHQPLPGCGAASVARSSRNSAISCRVSPVAARSARISPITLANL